jgi:hypothetical protein
VRVFSPTGALRSSFFAYDPRFSGGVRVAAGRLDGAAAAASIVTGPGPGGGPHVRTFGLAGNTASPGFFAFDPRFGAGVYVGAGDVNGDGADDILVGPGDGGPGIVRAVDRNGADRIPPFVAFNANAGARLAFGRFPGRGVVAATGPGTSTVVRVVGT